MYWCLSSIAIPMIKIPRWYRLTFIMEIPCLENRLYIEAWSRVTYCIQLYHRQIQHRSRDPGIPGRPGVRQSWYTGRKHHSSGYYPPWLRPSHLLGYVAIIVKQIPKGRDISRDLIEMIMRSRTTMTITTTARNCSSCLGRGYWSSFR